MAPAGWNGKAKKKLRLIEMLLEQKLRSEDQRKNLN
jgi:hypothetical protein